MWVWSQSIIVRIQHELNFVEQDLCYKTDLWNVLLGDDKLFILYFGEKIPHLNHNGFIKIYKSVI